MVLASAAPARSCSPQLHTGPGGATAAEVDPMAGRHSKGGSHNWWHPRGGTARSRPRLDGVTDAGTLVEHLMTGDAAPDGRRRYAAVCGAWAPRAALTAADRGCTACLSSAP
ncbi:MAG: hypothetical protein ACRDQX_16675 [Pseudonocardiaceae bacterium]